MLKTVREQASGLTKDQRNAFVAAYLGWAMDAFDYFLLVFVISDVAKDFDTFDFTATRPGSTDLGLEEAHRDLRISPAEFDEVAAELGRTLDFAKVPRREKEEVLAAFAAHKNEVTAGYMAAVEARQLMPT